MAKKQRKYDMEYKIQAVKLAKEIGGAKAVAELGIPENTLYAWMKAAREGRLDAGSGSHTPQTAMNLAEDECNDTYGRTRMYQALLLKQPKGIHIPIERTVYCIMEEIWLSHRPKRRPNGITKADREVRKSDDLLKRDFTSGEPLKKCITDITEIKAKDGKLYVSAIFDCFDAAVLVLAMDTNMKAALCRQTLENAVRFYPALREAVIHSDRGAQYTSGTYREAVHKYEILQSINSAGGRCHDNARCESMWAQMKEELLYGRYHTEEMNIGELKTLIWRYFISYWNNRRICSANEWLPPIVKRQRYYESLDAAA